MDIKQTQDIQNSLAPAARTASANGSGVDLANFASATVAFVVGTITDGTHTPSVEESDDNTTFTAVAAADLIGSLAALASNTNQRVGYRGSKRYVRAVSTVAGATTGGVYAGVVIRGDARKQPVA